MEILLNFLVICGLCAVGSAFIVLLPTVGQTLSMVWGVIFTEQAYAKVRGRRSMSDQDDHSLETQLKNAR